MFEININEAVIASCSSILSKVEENEFGKKYMRRTNL